MARLSMYAPAPRTHARAETVHSILGSPLLHQHQTQQPDEDTEMAEDWDEDQTLVHLANPTSDDSDTSNDTNIDDLLAQLSNSLASAEAVGLARTSAHLLPATRAARAAHADLAERVDRQLAVGVTEMRAALVEAGKRVGSERPNVDVAAGNKRDKERFAELQARYRMRSDFQKRRAALVEEKGRFLTHLTRIYSPAPGSLANAHTCFVISAHTSLHRRLCLCLYCYQC